MKLRLSAAIHAALAAAALSLGACSKSTAESPASTNATAQNATAMSEEHICTKLTPEQYRILREKGTEAPFTGAFWNNHEHGEYHCAGCGTVLFTSETKFDSGTGWPSFHSPSNKTSVKTIRDTSHGMVRTEVLCAKCGGHLGHVFEDGPAPTGLRFCINSAALVFKKKE